MSKSNHPIDSQFSLTSSTIACELHERQSLIMSAPHTMVEYVNEDCELDFAKFEKENPELYNEFCEFSIEELEECLSEIYASGGYEYIPVAEAIREQQEDIRASLMRIP